MMQFLKLRNIPLQGRMNTWSNKLQQQGKSSVGGVVGMSIECIYCVIMILWHSDAQRHTAYFLVPRA